MRRVIGVLAFIAYFYSLVVHISSYLGNNYVGGIRGLALLHIGAIIGGGILLSALRRHGWNRGELTGLVGMVNFLPWQSRPIILGLYFYAIANGFLSLIARDIVKMLSGYWLAIYLVVAIYFLSPSTGKKKVKVEHSLNMGHYFYDRGEAEPEEQVPAPGLPAVRDGRQRISAIIGMLISYAAATSVLVWVGLCVIVVIDAFHGSNLYSEMPGLSLLHCGTFILWAVLMVMKIDRMPVSHTEIRAADGQMKPLMQGFVYGLSRYWRR